MRAGYGKPVIRAWWLWVAFFSGMAFSMWAEETLLSWRDNQLQFNGPRVHFLTGKSLDRLRNAAEVPFDFQITLFAGSRSRVERRASGRFVVSYDLWEEKFSVTRLSGTRRTAAHLSALAAETWCLEQMPVDSSGIGDTQPLWIRLEVRAQQNRPGGSPFGRDKLTESGISLNGLVEVFSRPAQSDQPHWTVEAGPFTLGEIRRGRG